MSDLDDDITGVPADGRVARRERNVNAVLDVVLEMFGEDAMFPTIEQAATRSGLSLRSLYRYFADPGELLEAAIKRSGERGVDVSRLHAIGEGSLGPRIDDFVSMRLRLYDEIGPMYRATVANATRLPRIETELAATRAQFTEQFELQFAPELMARNKAARQAALNAGDLMTQLDSVHFLRGYRGLSATETVSVLVSALHSLLD